MCPSNRINFNGNDGLVIVGIVEVGGSTPSSPTVKKTFLDKIISSANN